MADKFSLQISVQTFDATFVAVTGILDTAKRRLREMYMTRFQSDVSPKGIDREHLYECLWCGEDEVMRFEDRGLERREAVAA